MACHHAIFEAESDNNSYWTPKIVNGRTVLEMSTCSGNNVNQWGGGATHPRPATLQQITDSVLTYTFTVPEACNYQVDVYGRAWNTQPQSDHNNDFWVALPSGSDVGGQTPRGNIYHKMYRPNNGQLGWSITDVGNTFCKRLPAGTHTLEIAARSCFMQIDRIVVWCKEGCAFDTAWSSKPAGSYNGGTVVNPGGCTKPLRSTSLYKDGDVLALHYDIAPDLDDLHAMAAACSVIKCYELDPCVVIGAHGENRLSDYKQFQNGDTRQGHANDVAAQAFGSYLDTNGIGSTQWTAAVNTTAQKWKAAVQAGNDVWLAEGGPSDFTRDVLIRMKQLGCTDAQLRARVHVVQHSTWNENETNNADLATVQNLTDYIKIADGNGGGNGTADLNNNANLAAFQAWAAVSPCAAAWEEAFQGLNPSNKLDFSDTVELLHILGVPTSEINSPTDFCNFFECDEVIVEPPVTDVNTYKFWVDGVLFQEGPMSMFTIPTSVTVGAHVVTGECCVVLTDGGFYCTAWVCEIEVIPGTGNVNNTTTMIPDESNN